MKLGRGWTQSPPGIAYHETSVLIPLSAEEVHFTEQPVFNHNFLSHLPHLGLASFLMFAVLFYFVTFCSVGWLRLPRCFLGGRGHVRMYLPLSPCLSLHDLLFALSGTLLVT